MGTKTVEKLSEWLDGTSSRITAKVRCQWCECSLPRADCIQIRNRYLCAACDQELDDFYMSFHGLGGD